MLWCLTLRNINGEVGLIEYISDIPSLEDDLTDRIRNRMTTWVQHIMFLRNDKQKIVADGNPYLRVYGILGGSVESLYVQMLLYPFEEQFNLPSFPIQLSDGQGFKFKIVGKETVNCICAKVFIYNKPERVRILQGGQPPQQPDGLIRDESGRLVNFSVFNDCISILSLALVTKKALLR